MENNTYDADSIAVLEGLEAQKAWHVHRQCIDKRLEPSDL